MSYATSGEVLSLFRDVSVDADSAISTTDMALYLENTTEEIDSKIGTLYSLPITSGDNPKSFKVLRMLQMYMVAGIIDDILNNYSEADKKPMWTQMAQKMLKQIVPDTDKKGYQPVPTLKLTDADYLGTSQQSNQIIVRAKTGKIFEKGKDNW